MTGKAYKIEYKQIDRKRKKHRKKHYLLKFLLFIAFCAGTYYFLQSSYFDVKAYQVNGNGYYTDDEVLNMAKVEFGNNIIFDSGAGDIEDILLENPYFKEVDVSRKLPSTLTINIVERPQKAAVVYGDNYVVIDDEGVVLRKTDILPELTILTGLTISKMNIGENLQAEENDTLGMTLRMIDVMYEGDIYFKKIDVSKVIVRAYIYDTLIVKGTPAEIMKAIENGQLQRVVADLFKEGIDHGTIKMGADQYMSFSPEIDEE